MPVYACFYWQLLTWFVLCHHRKSLNSQGHLIVRIDGVLSDLSVLRVHSYITDLGISNLDYEIMLFYETRNLALVDIFIFDYQESLSHQ